MLKEIPALRQKIGLFDDIFGRVYFRVDYKFYCLVVFALKKAEDVRIKVTEKDFFNED